MSYSTTSHATISGSVDGSFSYPASQNGGTNHVTLHWSENVAIVVTVHDDVFQHSVGSCKNQVDLMTGAVVATEAAQIASKAASSKRVAETISSGFNGLIESEINQQMAELAAMLPPKLQELKALTSRCIGLRQQMERDFARISERYQTLFSGLDSELKRRVLNLDRQALEIARHGGAIGSSPESAVPVTRALVTSGEQSAAEASLQSHQIRQRAMGMIESARKHLTAGQSLGQGLRGIQDEKNIVEPGPVCLPMLLIEADGMDGRLATSLLAPPDPAFAGAVQPRRAEIMSMAKEMVHWEKIDDALLQRLGERLEARMVEAAQKKGDDTSARREFALIQGLWSRMRPDVPQGGAR